MQRRITILLTAVLVSLPFWVGINLLQKNVEDFLVHRQNFLTAQIYPSRSEAFNGVLATTSKAICQISDISAQSFLVLEVNTKNQEKVVLEKNSQNRMPQASITKLMTYLVASEFYKTDQQIEISKDIVSQPENLGGLNEGEILEVKELIPMMLVESSNDAAFALTKLIGQEGFVELMNLKARELGLANTYFYNPTGIDPAALELPQDQINYSSALDIAHLTKHLIFSSPEFLSIVSQKEYPLYQANGKLYRVLKNTNELLEEMPGIIGGKTGTTDRAGECLMVIMQGKDKETYLIGVVLNSKQRYENMKMLLNCVWTPSM